MFNEISKKQSCDELEENGGLLALIAAASFVIGLVLGIICTAGVTKTRAKRKARKAEKAAFDAGDYADDLNFEDSDDFEGYEYSF